MYRSFQDPLFGSLIQCGHLYLSPHMCNCVPRCYVSMVTLSLTCLPVNSKRDRV